MRFQTQRGIVAIPKSETPKCTTTARHMHDSSPLAALVFHRTSRLLLLPLPNNRTHLSRHWPATRRYMKQNLDTFFELSAWHLAELEDMETGFRYGANKRDKEHPLWPFHEPF